MNNTAKTDADGVVREGNIVQADSGLCRRLALIDAAGSRSGEISQRRADELLARIAWSRLAEPGDKTAGALIAYLGAGPMLQYLVAGTTPKRILEAIRRASDDTELDGRTIAAGLKRWLPRLDRSATVADVERGIAAELHILTPQDALWPQSLHSLEHHAPVSLWIRGNPAVLSAHSLAIVGARAATGYGTHVTAEIADGVCAAGITIISGAAYGIDAVAHRTALAAQSPTVAVLAGGVDKPYPEAHRTLLGRIAASGAVCSEMVPSSAPTRWRFLQRNRLIAALSGATLVTEAGTRSGSLNTAGHAAEIGRPLGAAPGPVTSATSAGCHRLVRDYGASLVTNAAEATELLGLDTSEMLLDAATGGSAERASPGAPRQSALHLRVIDALPLRGGRSLVSVARGAGIGFDEARGCLAELEVLGFVKRYETPGDGEEKWVLKRRE